MAENIAETKKYNDLIASLSSRMSEYSQEISQRYSILKKQIDGENLPWWRSKASAEKELRILDAKKNAASSVSTLLSVSVSLNANISLDEKVAGFYKNPDVISGHSSRLKALLFEVMTLPPNPNATASSAGQSLSRSDSVSSLSSQSTSASRDSANSQVTATPWRDIGMDVSRLDAIDELSKKA